MKSNLLFLLICMGHVLSAQIFTEVPQVSQFKGVISSSIAFADVDGDDNPDVLITGNNGSGPSSNLYHNDGNGSFIKATVTPFEDVHNSSIAFADVDGDQDPDVLIAGDNGGYSPITKLYLNGGLGNFTEVQDSPFDGVTNSSIAFADVDGDQDPDVLISGYGYLNEKISKLYSNDGNGNFTEVMGTPFEGVGFSSIAFADVDMDQDQDVLITGASDNSDAISKLYLNDGLGNFSEVQGTSFEGIKQGSIAFADVDGDQDPDVLITGYWTTNLYLNDGRGGFTKASDTQFDGVTNSSIAFADVDGDQDQDVLITGDSGSSRISKLYTNDGRGIFTESQSTPSGGVSLGSIAFADVDGDDDPDLLITGKNNSELRISNLYLNDGRGNFNPGFSLKFRPSTFAFADVDGEFGPDLLITGSIGSFPYDPISAMYLNDGMGGFNNNIGIAFFDPGLGSSSAFADVDGDDDPDLLITGNTGTKLYLKTGNKYFLPLFTLAKDTHFEGVEKSSIAFADVDRDNDQDILITGKTFENKLSLKLYTNDGGGNFTEASNTPFEAVYIGSVAFSDVDGDDDPDLLITGNNGSEPSSKLYLNDGTGGFTKAVGTPFENVHNSSIAFTDVDGDDDQDVLITGGNGTTAVSKLYLNDGLGNFAEAADIPFEGVFRGAIAFSDVDGDDDPDVLITGLNRSMIPTSKLYLNNGRGHFTEDLRTPFEGISDGSIAFADVDRDGDPDVLISGWVNLSTNNHIFKLYKNDNQLFPDADLDGVADSEDVCPDQHNFTAPDMDGDRIPDSCDDCKETGSIGLAFDGADDYLHRDNIPSFNISANTIEMWIYLEALPVNKRSWPLFIGPWDAGQHWIINTDGTAVIGPWGRAGEQH